MKQKLLNSIAAISAEAVNNYNDTSQKALFNALAKINTLVADYDQTIIDLKAKGDKKSNKAFVADLKRWMHNLSINQKQLATGVDLSTVWVSNCMNEKQVFSQSSRIKIKEFLNELK